jgi:hypothetical protein
MLRLTEARSGAGSATRSMLCAEIHKEHADQNHFLSLLLCGLLAGDDGEIVNDFAFDVDERNGRLFWGYV